MVLAAVPPGPNSLVTLGLDFAVGLIASGFLFVFGWKRPVGMYERYLRFWGRVIVIVAGPLFIVDLVTVGLEPGQWPKGLAVGSGLVIGGPWVVRRVYRNRGAPPAAIRQGFRPLDYLIGAGLYLGFTAAIVQASHGLPAPDLLSKIEKIVSLFLLSQISINLMFRIMNSALEHDYGASLKAHYALVALPVVGSVVLYVALSAAPTGPLFRLTLLGAAWRYTTQRPAGVLKTMKSLRERLRGPTHGIAPGGP